MTWHREAEQSSSIYAVRHPSALVPAVAASIAVPFPHSRRVPDVFVLVVISGRNARCVGALAKCFLYVVPFRKAVIDSQMRLTPPTKRGTCLRLVLCLSLDFLLASVAYRALSLAGERVCFQRNKRIG
jgi:hypothetical protein